MKLEKMALAGLVAASSSVSGQSAEKFQSIDVKNNQTEIMADNNKPDTSLDYHISNDDLINASKKADESRIDSLNASISKDYFKQEALKYKEHGMLMACNLASEKPTEYQEEKIKELKDSIISSLEGKKFNSTSELIMFINQSTDSCFSNNETSIYLKDAFPEKEGEKSKGSFDCDSRSVFNLSILEKIGISNDKVGFCVMEGHALLKVKTEDSFIEMTTNKPYVLDKDAQVQLEEIDSFDKFYSYLLAKEGVALSYEADINIFDSSKKKDESKMKLALEKIKEASELDPNNLTTNLNLLRILKQSNIDTLTSKSISSKASSNIERFLINNYYGVNPEGVVRENIIKTGEMLNQKTEPRRLEDLGEVNDLTSKAIGKSEYLQSKFFDLGSDMYYEFDNKEEAIRIFTNLSNSIDLNSLDKDKEKIGMYLMYQRYISKCYFNSGKYEEYLKFTNGKLMNIQSKAKKDENLPEYMRSQIARDMIDQDPEIMVANILTGRNKIDESNIADFCESYKDDPIVGYLIRGTNMSSSHMDANEALIKWPGYQNLVNLINSWKDKNTK